LDSFRTSTRQIERAVSVQRESEQLLEAPEPGSGALLAPFGLDARDPRFWQGGLGVIEGMIDELEGLG
jgi:oligoendopeptidase F